MSHPVTVKKIFELHGITVEGCLSQPPAECQLWPILNEYRRGVAATTCDPCPDECDPPSDTECEDLECHPHGIKHKYRITNFLRLLKAIACPADMKVLITAVLLKRLREYLGGELKESDEHKICEHVEHKKVCDLLDLIEKLEPSCDGPTTHDYECVANELCITKAVQLPLSTYSDLNKELKRWKVPEKFRKYFNNSTFMNAYKPNRTFQNFIAAAVLLFSGNVPHGFKHYIKKLIKEWLQFELVKSAFDIDISEEVGVCHECEIQECDHPDNGGRDCDYCDCPCEPPCDPICLPCEEDCAELCLPPDTECCPPEPCHKCGGHTGNMGKYMRLFSDCGSPSHEGEYHQGGHHCHCEPEPEPCCEICPKPEPCCPETCVPKDHDDHHHGLETNVRGSDPQTAPAQPDCGCGPRKPGLKVAVPKKVNSIGKNTSLASSGKSSVKKVPKGPSGDPVFPGHNGGGVRQNGGGKGKNTSLYPGQNGGGERHRPKNDCDTCQRPCECWPDDVELGASTHVWYSNWTQYDVPKLPECWVYSNEECGFHPHGEEGCCPPKRNRHGVCSTLRRLFSADAVLKFIEWKLLKTLELPRSERDCIAKKMSLALICRLWKATSICDLFKMCAEDCPEDKEVLQLLKDVVLCILLARGGDEFTDTDAIVFGGVGRHGCHQVYRLSVKMLLFWDQLEHPECAGAICTALDDCGRIKRDVLLASITDRLKKSARFRELLHAWCPGNAVRIH